MDVDYLIVGGGAMGLIFADQLLGETDATLAIVDRRDMPGGHWNDAYGFVRLHQPSAFYGAGSRRLGRDRLDEHGFNKGFYELAPRDELLAYFDGLLHERLIASGRVHWRPGCDHVGDGRLLDRRTGAEARIGYRRLVDATYFNTETPSTHTPGFTVAPGVRLVAPGDLPGVVRGGSRYVVLGAGKTAIDTLVWLIEGGADPADITWVAPRDSWLTNREMVQPGDAFFERRMRTQAATLEAAAQATSVEDLFDRLEAAKALLRIYKDHRPTMYRGAIISETEAAMVGQVRHVVRAGHVVSLSADRIELAEGGVTAPADALFIDCTARGFGEMAPRPVFDGARITIQMVRANLTSFSAAVIAKVEASYEDDAVKNELCRPIAPAQTPMDWLTQNLADLRAGARWTSEPELRRWIAAHRLTGFGGWPADSAEAAAEISARTRTARPLAQTNLERLLAETGAVGERRDAALTV